MSRAAVVAALSDSSELNDLGYVADEIYRSTGMENTQAEKYIVLRWGDTDEGVGSSDPTDLTVWVYDMPGSYTDIDKALEIIRAVLSGLVQAPGMDGMTLTQVKWRSFSSDLYDDALHRVARYALFTVNSRVS